MIDFEHSNDGLAAEPHHTAADAASGTKKFTYHGNASALKSTGVTHKSLPEGVEVGVILLNVHRHRTRGPANAWERWGLPWPVMRIRDRRNAGFEAADWEEVIDQRIWVVSCKNRFMQRLVEIFKGETRCIFHSEILNQPAEMRADLAAQDTCLALPTRRWGQVAEAFALDGEFRGCSPTGLYPLYVRIYIVVEYSRDFQNRRVSCFQKIRDY